MEEMTQANDVAPLSINVVVSDFDRAVNFYAGAFGYRLGHERKDEADFEPVLQLSNVKFREGFLVLGSTMLTLICFERPESIPAPAQVSNRLGLKLIAFSVTDIDAVAERVVRFGGQVLEETRLVSQHGTQIIVTDPDGTQLELVQRSH